MDGDKSYGDTVGVGTIMQQTAVLKFRNYTATETIVLRYGVGLYCVYYTASISGDNSQFSCIKQILKTCISILMHTTVILVNATS